MNIIAYSAYGPYKLYLNGIFENIELAKKYYPDWKLRFYIARNCPALPKLREYDSDRVQIVEMVKWDAVPGSTCNADGHQDITHAGMTWRNYAIFDSGAEYVILRDLDSRLSEREAASVAEWMESGLPIHTIYDNPIHVNNGGVMPGLSGYHAPAFQHIYPSLQSYKNKFQEYYQWYTMDGYDRGLRLVHFDIHACRELLIKPIGWENVYRAGYGTNHPLKVPMPSDGSAGAELGATVHEELRFQKWEV